ncbi:hypothetical protein [Ascidiaceihabitans sp.]
MLGQFALPVYAGLGTAVVLATIFSFAPLTGGGAVSSQSNAVMSQIRAEASFCASNLKDVNCGCFGRISGLVQSETQPKVPGAFYADQQQLARGQALRSC